MHKCLPRLPLATLLIGSLSLTLVACASPTRTQETEKAAAQPAPSQVCAVFKTITFDRLNDTLPTIQQVKDSNARRASLCGS